MMGKNAQYDIFMAQNDSGRFFLLIWENNNDNPFGPRGSL